MNERYDHRSYEAIFSNYPKKNQASAAIKPRTFGAMLYQLSYEAIHGVGSWSNCGFYSPHEWNGLRSIYIYNIDRTLRALIGKKPMFYLNNKALVESVVSSNKARG